MTQEKEIKVIKRTERIRVSKKYFEREGDFKIRMAMAKELQDMGLKTDSIERILSIRFTSGRE